MTTARDVIARRILDVFLDGERCKDTVADAVLDALLSAPESVRLELAALLNPWRPIETAPKDGDTYLLGCFGEHGYGMQFVAFWDDEATTATNHWQTADGIAYHDNLPTHWLPLPAPPSEDK
jgi:hypothetical protein